VVGEPCWLAAEATHGVDPVPAEVVGVGAEAHNCAVHLDLEHGGLATGRDLDGRGAVIDPHDELTPEARVRTVTVELGLLRHEDEAAVGVGLGQHGAVDHGQTVVVHHPVGRGGLGQHAEVELGDAGAAAGDADRVGVGAVAVLVGPAVAVVVHAVALLVGTRVDAGVGVVAVDLGAVAVAVVIDRVGAATAFVDLTVAVVVVAVALLGGARVDGGIAVVAVLIGGVAIAVGVDGTGVGILLALVVLPVGPVEVALVIVGLGVTVGALGDPLKGSGGVAVSVAVTVLVGVAGDVAVAATITDGVRGVHAAGQAGSEDRGDELLHEIS